MKYYGFIQSQHGADHVFLYTEDQIKQEFDTYGIDMNVLPTSPDENTWLDLFPIGGSNSGTSEIHLLPDDESAIQFLSQKALGTDYDDPPLVALAEYYWEIDNGSYGNGYAADFLKNKGLDRDQITADATKEIDQEFDDLLKILGITADKCYNDTFREMRSSDIYKFGEIMNFLDRKAEDIKKFASLTIEDRLAVYTLSEKETHNLCKLIVRIEPAGEHDFDIQITYVKPGSGTTAAFVEWSYKDGIGEPWFSDDSEACNYLNERIADKLSELLN